MVERPIKKADRQDRPADSDNAATSDRSAAPVRKNNDDRGKGKGKGKRDNRRDKEDAQPPVNLALMRGPKPSKAKPPVLNEDEPETVEATEATETDADATDAPEEATADS